MKHVNAEMIKAVADNTELVIFFRQEGVCRWSTANIHLLIRDPEYREFFLCLPQHKEACLHWLNGGEVEMQSDNEWIEVSTPQGIKWSDKTLFMESYTNTRIKPKKEKRWIIWNENQDSYHLTFLVDPSDKYEANFKFSIHEIEVEV